MFEESESLRSVVAVIVTSVSTCSSRSSQDILSVCLGKSGGDWFFYSLKMHELEDSMC